jgi:tetratricopeptide (TPR) repeat protein
MSRTTRYKIVYFTFIGGGALVFAWSMAHYRLPAIGFLGLVVILLVPGRILGYFWRDLLRGLRLLNAKKFAESARHSELFLQKLSQRPWLKKMIWLGSGTYSRDPEAMALNNLGAAEIGLGDCDSARRHLEASIAVDDEFPLPYFNIGVMLYAAGDQQEAMQWLQNAVARGYSRSLVDKVISAAQTRYASTDGRGRT